MQHKPVSPTRRAGLDSRGDYCRSDRSCRTPAGPESHALQYRAEFLGHCGRRDSLALAAQAAEPHASLAAAR